MRMRGWSQIRVLSVDAVPVCEQTESHARRQTGEGWIRVISVFCQDDSASLLSFSLQQLTEGLLSPQQVQTQPVWMLNSSVFFRFSSLNPSVLKHPSGGLELQSFVAMMDRPNERGPLDLTKSTD